jgi:hypothetical protein
MGVLMIDCSELARDSGLRLLDVLSFDVAVPAVPGSVPLAVAAELEPVAVVCDDVGACAFDLGSETTAATPCRPEPPW